MRYNKMTIALLTVLLAVIVVFFRTEEPEPSGAFPISLTVVSQTHQETVDCWEASENTVYFFLPGYAQPSQIFFQINSRSAFYLNGQLLTEDTTCDGIVQNEPYTLNWEEQDYSVYFIQSANLPTLYIDVYSGNMAYIHAQKGNEEPGALRLYGADGSLLHSGVMDSINGRGNGSWESGKKPYSITLSNAADLLGMGAAKEWILLANAYDPTLLRNKIVYDFAAAVGMEYTPECRWVDLYLNGEYAGLYLLCERNEVHANRVNLTQRNHFLVSKELTYRLEEQALPYIQTASGVSLRIHASTMDNAALTQLWQSAENAILAQDGIDPVTGRHWEALIDLDSWAQKYLIEEVFGNADAGVISQFFYYSSNDSTGKIFAGPVWDQEIAIGNTMMWPEYVPNMFFVNDSAFPEASWFYELYRKDTFYQQIRQLWKTSFLPAMEELLDGRIQTYALQIQPAANANAIRWLGRAYTIDWEYLQDYLTQRTAFLDDLWSSDRDCCFVQVKTGGGLYACYVLSPGDVLPPIPSFDDGSAILQGWYLQDTDLPFDITQPIYEDTKIYLKQEATAQ